MKQRGASRRCEAPRSRTLRGKRRSGGRLTLAPSSPGAEPLQRYGLRFLLATLYNYRGHAAVALGNRRGSDERARGAALPAHRPACAGGEQSMKRAEKLPFFDCAYSSCVYRDEDLWNRALHKQRRQARKIGGSTKWIINLTGGQGGRAVARPCSRACSPRCAAASHIPALALVRLAAAPLHWRGTAVCRWILRFNTASTREKT